MGVVKTSIFTIYDLFPEQREKIRRLFSTNPDFQSLCEDFRQSTEALLYWSKSNKINARERMEEYLALQRELAGEIIRFLNEAE